MPNPDTPRSAEETVDTFADEVAKAFAATTALKLGLAPEDPMRDHIATLQFFVIRMEEHQRNWQKKWQNTVDVYSDRLREAESQRVTPASEPLPEWVEKIVARIDSRGAYHKTKDEEALVYMRDYIANRLSTPTTPVPTISGIPVRVDPSMPPGHMKVVDQQGREVHRIINLGNSTDD